MKIVIVGGVAGGMSAATRLRRLNEEAEIIILEKGPYVSFANCGLPYYISGEIRKREKLMVQSPKSLNDRFLLDVRVNTEALNILPDKKAVRVKGEEGEYEISYDRLILSPGAKPIIPEVPGLEEAKNLFTMRNIPDADKVYQYIASHAPQNAVVIGGGFIGLEMAEALKMKGMDVKVVEMAPQILPPFDYEMSVFVYEELNKNGIRVYTGDSAVRFVDEGRCVVLASGRKLESDLTIMSAGVRPESGIAESAGIKLGHRGGILVDENYETSVRDIYAVGDAAIVENFVSKEESLIPLAGPANRQGRQAADVISGIKRKRGGTLGTAIVRVFGLTAASTGLNERQLKAAGLNFKSVHVTANDHAGYFPGASSITLKLIFSPENGTIYGAQAVGEKGVDKRIDIIATAIKGGIRADELPELEFTYSPPYGSAKDPVHMAGYAALNIMEGISDNIQWHELEEMKNDGTFLLDVREPKEVEKGKITGFTNIPLNSLRERLGEIPQDRPVIVSCQSGQRSYMAERILKQKGYQAFNLDGAFTVYSRGKKEDIEIPD